MSEELYLQLIAHGEDTGEGLSLATLLLPQDVTPTKPDRFNPFPTPFDDLDLDGLFNCFGDESNQSARSLLPEDPRLGAQKSKPPRRGCRVLETGYRLVDLDSEQEKFPEAGGQEDFEADQKKAATVRPRKNEEVLSRYRRNSFLSCSGSLTKETPYVPMERLLKETMPASSTSAFDDSRKNQYRMLQEAIDKNGGLALKMKAAKLKHKLEFEAARQVTPHYTYVIKRGFERREVKVTAKETAP